MNKIKIVACIVLVTATAYIVTCTARMQKPAIANAIAQATGADIRQIPVTPEKLMEMMEGVHA